MKYYAMFDQNWKIVSKKFELETLFKKIKSHKEMCLFRKEISIMEIIPLRVQTSS